MNDEQITPPAPRDRRLLLILVALLVLILAAIGVTARYYNTSAADTLTSADFTAGDSSVAQLPDGLGGLQPGDPAPAFTLQDMAGQPVSLSEFAGQPVMINFWATWCAPCELEMPELQEAYEQHADDGFVILALNQDETVQSIEPFYERLKLTFPALLDTNMVVAAEYGAFSIYPSSYFIDRSGNIAAVHRGLLTGEQLAGYLELILPAAQ